jgi:hypothetical protein
MRLYDFISSWENIRDTKYVIRIPKSQKDQQYNDQQKKDKQYNDQQKKDKHWYTKHYTENKRSSNMNPTKNRKWTQVVPEGLSVPAPFLLILLISHEWGKGRIAITTSRTQSWSLFSNGMLQASLYRHHMTKSDVCDDEHHVGYFTYVCNNRKNLFWHVLTMSLRIFTYVMHFYVVSYMSLWFTQMKKTHIYFILFATCSKVYFNSWCEME